MSAMTIYDNSKITHKHKTRESYINDANDIHHYKYDYTLIPENVKRKDKVFIICPDHGKFEQQFHNHLLGRGCRKCATKKQKEKVTKTTSAFIEELKFVHGNRYDYSKVEYIGSHSTIIIICEEHGIYEQTAARHLRGQGCPKCAITERTQNSTSTNENFANKAAEIHNNKYTYELVDYKHSQEYVLITCPDHGSFEQIPNAHLMGQGCPKCTKNGFRVDKPAFLYVLLISSILGTFVGYGITDDIKRRMKEHRNELGKYGYSIIDSYYSKEVDGFKAKDLEHEISKIYPLGLIHIDGFKTENTHEKYFIEIKEFLATI